jgi:hypothetical protein
MAMLTEHTRPNALESLSSEMFAPLSEREASLVIGGEDIYVVESFELVAHGDVTVTYSDGSQDSYHVDVYERVDWFIAVI